MARFYAGIQGNRGEATRLGTPKSGLTAFIQGWDAGVRVKALVNGDGKDVFHVFATSGSNGRGSSIYIGYVVETETGFEFIRSEDK